MRIILVLAVIALASSFTLNARRSSRTRLRAEGSAEEKPHETYIEGPAPYGKQFFQADIGKPSKDTDFGGGIVGGIDFEDALYSKGPRGTNKPKITDKAVVKLPDMNNLSGNNVGYSEAKAKMQFEIKKKYWKVQGEDPWTPQEDQHLLELIEKWPEGTRGRWVKISDEINRSTADVNSRWFHHLKPNTENDYRDILADADRDLILKKKGEKPWSAK